MKEVYEILMEQLRNTADLLHDAQNNALMYYQGYATAFQFLNDFEKQEVIEAVNNVYYTLHPEVDDVEEVEDDDN